MMACWLMMACCCWVSMACSDPKRVNTGANPCSKKTIVLYKNRRCAPVSLQNAPLLQTYHPQHKVGLGFCLIPSCSRSQSQTCRKKTWLILGFCTWHPCHHRQAWSHSSSREQGHPRQIRRIVGCCGISWGGSSRCVSGQCCGCNTCGSSSGSRRILQVGGLRRRVVLVVPLLLLLLLLTVLFVVMVMGEDGHCRDGGHHPSSYWEDWHSLRVMSKSRLELSYS